MQRMILQDLLNWKASPSRMPLLLRGARQVGKTYIIREFARIAFEEFVEINFELQPEYKSCFSKLDPSYIIMQIKLSSTYQIIPGKTLIFFDEIQECPEAIVALRYFKEKMPELHIIGAGSLLGFALKDEGFHMPVGRIESLYMKPLSFYEFLLVQKREGLLEYLAALKIGDEINDAVKKQLEQMTKLYFILGGMPAVIANYLMENDLLRSQKIQLALLNTYRNDFSKYAAVVKHKYLERMFQKAPAQVGLHFKYAHIDPYLQTRDLKFALQCLVDAGVINLIHATNASGIPLNVGKNARKFKIAFLDLGLVNANSLLNPKTILDEDIMLINRGALAEQFVAQELIANAPNFIPAELFYWEREKSSAMAEVDYVINFDEIIIPIEVKAGKTGRLRSLYYFIENKHAPFGVRIATQPLSFERKVLSIPFYLIHQLDRLVQSCLNLI